MRVEDNLQRYLTEAILPHVDISQSKLESHYQRGPRPSLHIERQYWRKHGAVTLLYRRTFDKCILEFLQRNIPSTSLAYAPDTGKPFKVAAKGFDVRPPAFAVAKAHFLVEELVLQTATSSLHLMFPRTLPFFFIELEDGHDASTVRMYRFTSDMASTSETERSSLVVFVIPPWIFTDIVIRQFRSVQKLESRVHRDETGHRPRPSFVEQLWLKMWDTCVTQDAKFFVITSYNQWCFGGFSAGWTTSYISTARSRDSADPTILQTLVHWLASSLNIEDGFKIPSPPEDAHLFKQLAEPQGFSPPESYLRNCGDLDTSQPECEADKLFWTTPLAYPENPEIPNNVRSEFAHAQELQARLERVANFTGRNPPNTHVVQERPEEGKWYDDTTVATSEADSQIDLPKDTRGHEKYELTLRNREVKEAAKERKARAEMKKALKKEVKVKVKKEECEPCCDDSQSQAGSEWSAVGAALQQPFGGWTVGVHECPKTWEPVCDYSMEVLEEVTKGTPW